MSKQKAPKHIPVSSRPSVSVADLSSSSARDTDKLPDLSEPAVSEPEVDSEVESESVAASPDASPTEGESVVDVPEEAILFVYEPKCLGCSHLVAFAENTHNGCHFTAGNEDCPAQSVTISVKLPMTKIIRNFLRAEENGDTEKLGRLYGALSQKPEWAKRQILEALQEARERASAK
jgi:hypothetical protein